MVFHLKQFDNLLFNMINIENRYLRILLKKKKKFLTFVVNIKQTKFYKTFITELIIIFIIHITYEFINI